MNPKDDLVTQNKRKCPDLQTGDEMAESNSTQENRYRILLLTEAVLLVITAMVFFAIGYAAVGPWMAWPFALLMAWHIVVIPICVMYLIGRPVVMSLSPLIPSAESRAFRKRLAQQPSLSDTEFYRRFYAESGISGDFVARLRRCLYSLDPLIERATPDDNLSLLDDELDFVWVLELVEEEFGVKFVKETDYKILDGTLGNLLHITYSKINERNC